MTPPVLMTRSDISHSYKKCNEDLCGHVNNRFWMMDGATGLSDYPLFHSESDAHWLVHRYHAFFANNEPGSQPLENYVKDAVRAVVSSISNLTILERIEGHGLPTAGLFLGVFHQSRLRFLQLGDCKCLLHTNGQLHILGQSRLEHFDKVVVTQMKQMHAAGIQKFTDVWAALLPLLKRNRAMANKKNGYWILGFDLQAVENSLQGEIEIAAGDSMLAMTDGFARLFEVFDLIKLNQLLPTSQDRGLALLVEMLRRAETEDPECINYPRIKCHDDASALLIDVVAA